MEEVGVGVEDSPPWLVEVLAAGVPPQEERMREVANSNRDFVFIVISFYIFLLRFGRMAENQGGGDDGDRVYFFSFD